MSSIEKVIAATDLSESSNVAVELAAVVARGCQAEFHLCYVNESAGAIGLFPSFRSASTSLHDAAIVGQLKELGHKIDKKQEPVVAVVSAPHASNGILEYCEDISGDLIVMGSRGQGVWRRAFLGSVALETVEHACCSIMVVPGPVRHEAHASSTVARGPVLAVVDVESAGRVFEQGKQLARALRVRLELAYVPSSKPEGESVLSKGDWLEQLECALGGAIKLDSAQIKILDSRNGEQLVATARKMETSVIVLGRRQKALGDRHGLVRAVLSKAFCPVLAVN